MVIEKISEICRRVCSVGWSPVRFRRLARRFLVTTSRFSRASFSSSLEGRWPRNSSRKCKSASSICCSEAGVYTLGVSSSSSGTATADAEREHRAWMMRRLLLGGFATQIDKGVLSEFCRSRALGSTASEERHAPPTARVSCNSFRCTLIRAWLDRPAQILNFGRSHMRDFDRT